MVILTGWIIAGGILLFIILLLAWPVSIYIEYSDDIKLRVKYMFLTLYRIPAKPKKPKRQKKQKPKKTKTKKTKTAETKAPDIQVEEVTETAFAEEKNDPASVEALGSENKSDKKKAEKPKKEKKPKDPKIPTLPEIFELIKVFVDSLSKPLKKLLRRIKICNFDLRMICGGDDAAKAALNFGRMNLIIGNALGFFDSFFTLKNPHVDINVDFQSEKTVTEFSCTVKLSLLTLLAFAFTFLGRLIVRALKNSKVKGYIDRLRGK